MTAPTPPAPDGLAVWAPAGLPEIRPGDDLARLVGDVRYGAGT